MRCTVLNWTLNIGDSQQVNVLPNSVLRGIFQTIIKGLNLKNSTHSYINEPLIVIAINSTSTFYHHSNLSVRNKYDFDKKNLHMLRLDILILYSHKTFIKQFNLYLSDFHWYHLTASSFPQIIVYKVMSIL